MRQGSAAVSLWILTQIVVNIFFLAVLSAIWLRQKLKPQDDPRLSKGLQMVSSKIAILDDLSRRMDNQVEQINSLIDQKAKELLEQIENSERQILKIEQSLQKSLEVARIFEDKIPHHEIVERQNTMKYIKAAKMANEGRTLEEIQQAVDLSYAEIELILTVNKENLVFDDASLPAWLKEGQSSNTNYAGGNKSKVKATSDDRLKVLSEKFQKIPEFQTQSSRPPEVIVKEARNLPFQKVEVQRYNFPKI